MQYFSDDIQLEGEVWTIRSGCTSKVTKQASTLKELLKNYPKDRFFNINSEIEEALAFVILAEFPLAGLMYSEEAIEYEFAIRFPQSY